MLQKRIRVGVFDQIVSGGGVRLYTAKLLEEFSKTAHARWRFRLMWSLFDSSEEFLPHPRLRGVNFERIAVDREAKLSSFLVPLAHFVGKSLPHDAGTTPRRLTDYLAEKRSREQQSLRSFDGRGLRWLDERTDDLDLLWLPYPYLTLPDADDWRPRKPLVITLHDLAHEHTDAWGDLAERLRREVRRWTQLADLVIFSSDYVKHEAQRIYQIPEKRTRRIYLAPTAAEPVDDATIARVRSTHRLPRRYVLTLGWAAKHKRVETIIEGFARYKRESGDDATLVIAGPRTETLAATDIHGLRLGEDLLALGFVPGEDVPALYRDAALVVTASVSEAGLNAMILDAMKYHKPVICSRIEQFTERLGDKDVLALMFDPYSPASLARALHEHFRDPERAAARADAARAFVDARSLTQVGADYLDAFASVL